MVKCGCGGDYITESKQCPHAYEDANSIRARFLHIWKELRCFCESEGWQIFHRPWYNKRAVCCLSQRQRPRASHRLIDHALAFLFSWLDPPLPSFCKGSKGRTQSGRPGEAWAIVTTSQFELPAAAEVSTKGWKRDHPSVEELGNTVSLKNQLSPKQMLLRREWEFNSPNKSPGTRCQPTARWLNSEADCYGFLLRQPLLSPPGADKMVLNLRLPNEKYLHG